MHVLAGSKTGLSAPSFEAVQRLHERFGARLDVVVDACQMRLAPERVRAYLEAGCMVLITGSKFFGGPPFSGALLVPAGVAARAPELAPLPPGLAGYFTRPEWPAPGAHRGESVGARQSRARAALAGRALGDAGVRRGAGGATAADHRRARRRDPRRVEASRGCDRSPSRPGEDWPQTIFPFEVLRQEDDRGEAPMDLAAVQHSIGG